MKPVLRAMLLCLVLVLAATILRITYLNALMDDPGRINVGGDPNHHFNIAYNVAHGRGPFTDFVFSFWFRHPALPVMTDIYPPGVHYVLGLFMTIFGDEYAVARYTCLFFGSIAGCAALFLARQFMSIGPAFAVAAIVVLNPVHLEHSTIVMTPVIGSFFVWLAVAILLKYKQAYVWKGLAVGWGHLCMSALGPLSLAFLAREFLPAKDHANRPALLKRLVLYGIGVLLAVGPWALQTYRYFGRPLYTNFAFYPFTPNWVPMNYATVPPSVAGFVQSSGGIFGVTKLYFSYFLEGFNRCYTQALPLSAPVDRWAYILNVAIIGVGLIQLFRNGVARALAFVAFFTSFLFVLSLGSTANEGYLSTRHVLVFAPFVAILWVLGLQLIGEGLLRGIKVASPRLLAFIPRLRIAGYALVFILLSAATWTWSSYFRNWKYYDMTGAPESPFSEIFAFHYFWGRRSLELEQAAEWIRSNTSENAVFMYGKTPQDFWAATRRRVVVDPVFAGGQPSRAAEEVKFYNVNYLALDSNDTIYERAEHPADPGAAYGGLKLSKVWNNADSSFVIYKIEE